MPEPTIDPITGKPIITDPPVTPPAGDPPDPNAPPAPATVAVPADEWTAMKTRLDVFEKVGLNLNQPAAPAAPAPPSGPTLSDQVSEIDVQVSVLNTKIDEATAESKPISHLLTQRDTLTHRKTRLQIKAEDIDPAMATGAQTIEQISAKITRADMPHYDLVRTDVESALANLPVDQRMNPQMRTAAYNIAVGQNLDKILDAQKEEILRAATPAPGTPPPSANARSKDSKGNEVPKPSEVLSRDSLAALEGVGKTPDEYYKSRGYAGGWTEFYEKRGKEYFGAPATT